MANSQQKSSKRLKILFFALDGIGHLSASVGLAQALASREHRVFFLQNEAFKGQFSKYGFEEIFLKNAKDNEPLKQETEEPKKNLMKETAQQLLASGYLGPKSSLEKMRDQTPPEDGELMPALVQSMAEFDPQIESIIELEKPDLLVLDHVIVPPSIQKADIPWVYSWSANPIVVYHSDKLPPFGSGYPTESDPSTWQEYLEIWSRFSRHCVKLQAKINAVRGFEPVTSVTDPQSNMIKSPYLNVYGYPKELDYDDVATRPENLISVDAFSRISPEPFTLPESLRIDPQSDKIIYVSLGSVGSIDVELMKRIISVLEKTPHKCIISKGQRHDEYDLPGNCWGEPFLPQTAILPLVDLVITHGGNNTVTETFAAGKPMIVMPLFADQYDNAQRIQEKGYGMRLEPYEFTEDQLLRTIDRLLNNQKLAERLEKAKDRIAKENQKEQVCNKIEELAEKERR